MAQIAEVEVSKDGQAASVLTALTAGRVWRLTPEEMRALAGLYGSTDSLLEIYGDAGEDIAVKILGLKAFIRAILAALGIAKSAFAAQTRARTILRFRSSSIGTHSIPNMRRGNSDIATIHQ
jgi:hypothetical protein